MAGPVVVGWREFISFPDWDVKRIRAKTDTGARSTAIDVASIREVGKEKVRFHVIVDRKRNIHRDVTCRIARRSRVKSSNGKSEERIFVRTRILIGPVEKEVEVGLVCRKNMLCRALIGRSTLDHDFLIDTSKKYLTDRDRKKKKAVAHIKKKKSRTS